ncbi:uncharacterized protein DS421_6g194870 [Arachis hypogaea]|nr:uncharacterized protein DS421_6g194870 [Arachis hypogaea]
MRNTSSFPKATPVPIANSGQRSSCSTHCRGREKESHCNFFAWFDMVFDINNKNAIMDDIADANQLDDVVVGFQGKLMEL